MSKILVGELREAVKLNENPSMIEVDYAGLNIKVKTYISILDKINLASSIYYSAVSEEDELQIVNYNSIEIAYRKLVVEKYTNITLPKNPIDSYDLLTSSGLYETIRNTIPAKEINELEEVLWNYVKEKQDRYERENTVENIIKAGIDKLLEMVNKLIENLPSEEIMGNLPGELTGAFSSIMENFDKLDKEKKEYVGSLLNALKGDVGDGEGS